MGLIDLRSELAGCVDGVAVAPAISVIRFRGVKGF